MEFSDEKLLKIWEKATPVTGSNPKEWRKDYAGAWINFNQRGENGGKYGWEVDHRKPLSLNGGSELDNLDPLHWENNRTKGDDYPQWTTSITSKENENVKKTQSWPVSQK
ncbi:HNH endonuclease [Bacteroidales bacterium Barb4]|nr:HNH endonuclease [Bacteroidales bacterium Barb4]